MDQQIIVGPINLGLFCISGLDLKRQKFPENLPFLICQMERLQITQRGLDNIIQIHMFVLGLFLHRISFFRGCCLSLSANRFHQFLQRSAVIGHNLFSFMYLIV